MITKIHKVDVLNPKEQIIEEASNIIKQGGLVAFPTETVYGLGANGFDKNAINKIFEAKGRPADNPLIFHIENLEQLNEISPVITEDIKKLTGSFWPGPLTLVLQKNENIPYEATAGLDTVAVRMPANKIAKELIKKSNVPIVAPSANISGKPSPTSSVHVECDLAGVIDMILDGGSCDIGIESTVLDMTGHIPTILRPGFITKEDLEDVIGEVKLGSMSESNAKPRSPGMKYTHYKPSADLYIVDGEVSDVANIINKLSKINADKKIGVLASEQTKSFYKYGEILSAGESIGSIAFNLYRCLRQFDILGVDIIYSESFDDYAIMNRLSRAAGFNFINAYPTILFVCTGNTCRSPMAEYLAKDIFEKNGLHFNIESRGVSVFNTSAASENSIKVLKSYDISLNNHQSKQIKKDDIKNARLVLTMTSTHKRYLMGLSDFDNIFTLAEYAGLPFNDIVDPFGGSEKEYQLCAVQIKECIEKIIDKLR